MCRVSQAKFLLDKYIAGLCFYRTAFPIQKFSLKSSIFRPNPFLQIWPKSYRYNAVSNRFSTSLTNASRLLSRVKAGTHSALLKGSHTVAHTAKQGPSLPRPQRGLVLPAISLLFHHAFIYIHFPVLCEPSTPAEENNPAKLPHKFYPPTVSHPDF